MNKLKFICLSSLLALGSYTAQAAEITYLTFDVVMRGQSTVWKGQWIVNSNGSFSCPLTASDGRHFEGQCTGQDAPETNASPSRRRISIHRRAGPNNSDYCDLTGSMVKAGDNLLRVTGTYTCQGGETRNWDASVTPGRTESVRRFAPESNPTSGVRALQSPGFGEERASDFGNRFGCACIANKLTTAINYRYKWGDGQWKALQLDPGFSQAICWDYRTDRKNSPPLYFELDTDLTQSQRFEAFEVRRVQAAERTCAATSAAGKYHVGYRKDSDRKLIYLYQGSQ